MSTRETADLAIVGGGAAGLATAIFSARADAQLSIRVLDGARHLGAKILVSGGSRCNVTNAVVTERDFWGGSPRVVKHVLRAYPAARAARFFDELGVTLHEEEDGKLFPDTNSSRTVLRALLDECGRLGVRIESGRRVREIRRADGAFEVSASGGEAIAARAVVLATGGRSLPKTGSDGFGYGLARALGHGYVETTPGLAPLVLRGSRHAALAGIAHPASLTLRVDGRVATRLGGPLLWTHFGASGPVVLNMSRHWHRAVLAGAAADVRLNACDGEPFEVVEAWMLDQERARPRAQVTTALAARLPAAVANVCADAAGVPRDRVLAQLARDERRAVVRALTDLPLDVADSRGYAYAEVTAGGIPLDEINPATMESRRCPGLYLAGEILDVDGRLGGFNFQWAWSSGWVAAQAIAGREGRR